jgi:molybdate transport system substrate-binding protein
LDVLDRPEVVVAFANPRTAPYGAAARVLLDATGRGALTGARGESVGQVLQFVASGAADVGLLALAQVIDRPQADWAPIDPSLYPELRQDVVLLRAGAEVPGARALLDHLVSPPVRDLVARRGYAAPAGPPSHPDSP